MTGASLDDRTVRIGTQSAGGDGVRGGAGAHVCMVAYTSYRFDGRVRREAELLARLGYRVLCLTTKAPRRKRTSFVMEGVQVQELPVSKYRGKRRLAYAVSYLMFLCAASVACLGRLMRGEADVVHVHNLPDFLVFAGLVPRLWGRKVVLDVHDSIPETFATKFPGHSALWSALCLEERVSARVADRVICVNEPQRDVLVRRGIPAEKTFVSMNVPDPRLFQPRQSGDRTGAGDGLLRLVYHGTMADRLGVDLLIQAMDRMRDAQLSLRLHLWGGGDDLSRYERLARELRVDDRVEFKPNGFPLEELATQLQAMDIGVVGNRRNVATDLMLPVKLLEYVALGIPAVVPRLKTIQHYFSDDMVQYFEPENVESLSEAILRLSRDPHLRRRQATLARSFLRDYGWERQGQELATFYQDLLRKGEA